MSSIAAASPAPATGEAKGPDAIAFPCIVVVVVVLNEASIGSCGGCCSGCGSASSGWVSPTGAAATEVGCGEIKPASAPSSPSIIP